MRVKLFGIRFIFEVKQWLPLRIMYGYTRKAQEK